MSRLELLHPSSKPSQKTTGLMVVRCCHGQCSSKKRPWYDCTAPAPTMNECLAAPVLEGLEICIEMWWDHGSYNYWLWIQYACPYANQEFLLSIGEKMHLMEPKVRSPSIPLLTGRVHTWEPWDLKKICPQLSLLRMFQIVHDCSKKSMTFHDHERWDQRGQRGQLSVSYNGNK